MITPSRYDPTAESRIMIEELKLSVIINKISLII